MSRPHFFAPSKSLTDGSEYGVGDSDEEKAAAEVNKEIDRKARTAMLDLESKMLDFHRPIMDKFVDGVKPKEIKGFDVKIVIGASDQAIEEPEALLEIESVEQVASTVDLFEHSKQSPETIDIVCHSSTFRSKTKHYVVSEGDQNRHAFSMETYRLERSSHVNRLNLMKSPYFAKHLAAEWKNAGVIHFRCPRPVTVKAVQLVLEYLANGTLTFDERNVFEVFAVARFFELHDLIQDTFSGLENKVERCNIIAATHFAISLAMKELLYICYAWIIENLVEKGQLCRIIWDELENQKGASTYRDVVILQGSYKLALHKLECMASEFLKTRKVYCKPATSRFVGHLIRNKDLSSLHNDTYMLYSNDSPDRPLLTATFNKENQEYLISSVSDCRRIRPYLPDVVGCVKSNLSGTEFLIYDYGASVSVPDGIFPMIPRVERAFLKYRRNILGSIPREFSVFLRHHEIQVRREGPDKAPDEPSPLTKLLKINKSSIEADLKAGQMGSLVCLQNTPPVWNEIIQAYTLDFGDSVKLPSKKNFKLHDETDRAMKCLMMFGKNTREKFHIEFESPLSAVTAFGIVLSSFDKKRLVT